MQDLSLIEKSHVAKILVVCLREGDVAKGVLYQILKKNTNVLQDKIEELVKAKLLTEVDQVDEKGYHRKIISLTSKGKKVAEHLNAIEGILAE